MGSSVGRVRSLERRTTRSIWAQSCDGSFLDMKALTKASVVGRRFDAAVKTSRGGTEEDMLGKLKKEVTEKVSD